MNFCNISGLNLLTLTFTHLMDGWHWQTKATFNGRGGGAGNGTSPVPSAETISHYYDHYYTWDDYYHIRMMTIIIRVMSSLFYSPPYGQEVEYAHNFHVCRMRWLKRCTDGNAWQSSEETAGCWPKTLPLFSNLSCSFLTQPLLNMVQHVADCVVLFPRCEHSIQILPYPSFTSPSSSPPPPSSSSWKMFTPQYA